MVESIQSSDRIVSSAALERPIRVLHVDDDPSFLKVAKQCLEMQGEIDIDTVSSVNEASEKLKKTDYDVIVSDYQMPGKDGLEFLKELREKGNTVPFIVFTGKGREEIAIKALNLGADGYFNKSGDPETVYGELAHGMRQAVGRRRAEQSFLKSEDKYRRLVETLHEGIWVIDKDSRTTFVNPRMAEILGYGIEEMKGRHLFSFMDERGVEIAKRLLERRKQNIKEQHDFEFLRKDGTRVYATLETAPITDDNGNYIGALASIMDITERKKAEEQIRDNEEQLSQLFMRMPSGVAVYRAVNNGEDFVFTDFNEAAERIEHVSRREIIGKCVTEVFSGVKDFGVFEVFQRVWRTGQSEYFPAALYKDDKDEGTWRESWIYKLPNGSIVAIYNDITERKRAEEA
jgi:PAS domain S-box-containing protein